MKTPKCSNHGLHTNYMERQTDRQTDRQTERHRERHREKGGRGDGDRETVTEAEIGTQRQRGGEGKNNLLWPNE